MKRPIMSLLVVAAACLSASLAWASECANVDKDFESADQRNSCLSWQVFSEVHATSTCYNAILGRRLMVDSCTQTKAEASRTIEPITAPAEQSSSNSREGQARELYDLAVPTGSCDALDLVATAYPDTNIGKLAMLEANDCTNSAAAKSVKTEPEVVAPVVPTPRPVTRNLQAECRHYWDGNRCVTNRRQLVRLTQTAFKAKGCPIGSVDGIWGKRTSAAVKALNRTNGSGYSSDGSSVQLASLLSEARGASNGLCDCRSGRIFSLNSGRCVKPALKVQPVAKRQVVDPETRTITVSPQPVPNNSSTTVCPVNHFYSVTEQRCLSTIGTQSTYTVTPVQPPQPQAPVGICAPGQSFSLALNACVISRQNTIATQAPKAEAEAENELRLPKLNLPIRLCRPGFRFTLAKGCAPE